MPESSPWDNIGVPDSDLNVKQIAGSMAVPCFWGRDRFGSCLFIMELDGEHTEYFFRKNNVRVNGIGVDLRTDGLQQRFLLTLEKQVDRDLFESLCRTLVRALENASDSASSLAAALAHIRRWKTFMSGRSKLLSAEEVRGLFAELVFLLELIDHIGATTAVEAWMGPERSHQDFIYSNKAVEIKSLSGSERSTVRISSEDQLASLNDHLFLRIYRLNSLPEAASARSLNKIVLDVQERLDSAEAVEKFDRKLVSYSYAPLPDYDESSLVVLEVRSYRIEGAFPRLIRSGIPQGVSRVGYDIKLESIATFECDAEEVFRGGDGTDG